MSRVSTISHLLPSLNKSHLIQSDISSLIDSLKSIACVDVQLIGHSFENRPIHLLTLGEGPIVIFAWTQMHGNEATATAAVFDLIDQLLSCPPRALTDWSSNFTIHILPMLNPDGAQRCIRQNAQSIDINRDARELQTPEGKLLMTMVNQLAPDIGFNLHDQSPYYQCGTSKNPATIAFLAPAYDVDKTINVSRKRAMALIAHMNKAVQIHIPGCVARYDDTYSIRSFGDNIAAKNISTILIESGAAKGDDDRQIARKMNVVAMLSALELLTIPEATKSTDINDKLAADYFAIPENVSESLSSLVVHNLSFAGNYPYTAGVSVKQTARYSGSFIIDFTGDLHTQAGLKEFDASGLQYQCGKLFTPNEAMTLCNDSYSALLRKGYLYFNDPTGMISNASSFDICKSAKLLHQENAFILQQAAYCLLVKSEKPSHVVAAMLNGKIFELA